MLKPRHTDKDSVFTYLFRQPGNALKLYLSLHPEDTAVSESDIQIVTLENVLVTGQYNDFGILVRDRLILLVEAQSTFSYNIPLRLFLYLADTYKRYVEDHKLSLYREKAVKIPRPEAYVVYTGPQPLHSPTLKLSSLYDGEGDVEVTVHVLQKRGNGDILDQYIAFCEIFNQQVALHGRTEKAVSELIHLCLERGILVPFLTARKKEVVDIMSLLFSQEKIWEIELYNAAQDAKQKGIAEGEARGRAEGEAKGRTEGEYSTIKKLLKTLPAEEVSNLLGKPLEEIRAIAQSGL